jgi:hypothetical protein
MRYIIIEKEFGVFVGAFDNYAIYAKNEIFGVDKIASFASYEEAENCIENSFSKSDKEYSIEAIDTPLTYIPIKDVIKAGFGKYTHRMMNNIPMISEEVH